MAKSLAQLIQEETAPAAPPAPDSSKDLIPKPSAEERRDKFAWHYLFGAKPFNAQEAYRVVNGEHTKTKTAKEMGSTFLNDPRVKVTLAKLIKAAAERHEIDEDFVLGHWIAMSEADIFDFFEMQTVGEDAGHLVLRAKDLSALSKMQRQNVRKLKVRNRSTTIKDVTTDEQEIELEIEHKKDAVKNLSVFLGMMKGKEGLDIEDLAQAIREGEERALNRAVTIDNATQEIVK